MSDPTVVGIPIGGAVAERGLGPGQGQGQAAAPALAARQPTAEHPATCNTNAAHETSPPSESQCLPRAAATTEDPAPAAHELDPPNNSLPSKNRRRPFLPSRPLFHIIGESVPKRASAAELPLNGSHIEVGVRGKSRGTRPPKPDSAIPEPRHPGRALAFASLAAVVIGSGFLIRALTLADPVPPPLPPAWANRAVGTIGHRATPLGYARPTRVTVARVGIHADVLALGLAQDGEIGVPPTKEPLMAAWYDRGPAPGQTGPAVITGHVDSRFAPNNRAAFYELGAVRPGDDVDVARADRRVAVFRVDSVALAPKSGFPTREVYGPTSYAALRLITCGGHYDRRTGYADDVIVYAHLVGSR